MKFHFTSIFLPISFMYTIGASPLHSKHHVRSPGILTDGDLQTTSHTDILSAIHHEKRKSGLAVVKNNCPYPLYIFSVDSTRNTLNAITVRPRKSYSEPFRAPCPGCGVSIKISRDRTCNKVTQFEYSLAGGRLWYDISLIDCVVGHDASQCPGHEKGLRIKGHGMGTCRGFRCGPGERCEEDAYYVPVPNGIQPVGACREGRTGGQLVFTACSG